MILEPLCNPLPDPDSEQNHAKNDTPRGSEAGKYDSASSDSEKHASVRWDDDPRNPYNWPHLKKWRVTVLSCFITFIVGINGTAMTAAADEINLQFGLSDEQFPSSFWPVFSWTLAAGIVPLAVLPLMETFGVRKAYLLIYLLFVVFIIPQARAQNFGTLIATRVITGGCAGILENITSGICGDLWSDAITRSLPINLYICSLLAGTTIGPVIGGAIITTLDWRWVFYIQIILYVSVFPFVFFLLPETRGEILERARDGRRGVSSRSPSHVSPMGLFKTAIVRPLRMLTTEPLILCATLWSSFCFGNALIFTQSIPLVYRTLYNFSAPSTGLVQAALVIGIIIGLLISPLQDRLYAQSGDKISPDAHKPEARLYLAIPASFLGLAGGLFLYAFTTSESHPQPWIAPTIGIALVGVGIQTVMTAASHYVEDAYPTYAASAIAGVAAGENIVGACLPLASTALYTESGLGFVGGSAVLAGIGCGVSFVPVAFVVFGPPIRSKSRLAATSGRQPGFDVA
ncbi:multidrug transporter [Phyllosticta citriasiana]|uniref:Multidrug transporter n=1 Tax=Phyllosticta citriasiana TaxID=595635 RepID=A0ABR1KLT4_9PEZI